MPDFLDNHGISSKIFIPSLPLVRGFFVQRDFWKDPRILMPLQQAPASLSQLSPATNVTSYEFSSLTVELWLTWKSPTSPSWRTKILLAANLTDFLAHPNFLQLAVAFTWPVLVTLLTGSVDINLIHLPGGVVADKQIRNSKRKVLSQNKIKFPRTRLNCRSPIPFPSRIFRLKNGKEANSIQFQKSRSYCTNLVQYAPLMTPVSTEFTWFPVDASDPSLPNHLQRLYCM